MVANICSGDAPLPSDGWRRTFVRDLVLPARIGVYPHEHEQPQRIRVDVQCWTVDDPATDGIDRLDRVMNYELIVAAVHATVDAGHVKLVETLAERIAAACLTGPVRRVQVMVEKLDVFPGATSAGVEIIRLSTSEPEAE